MATNDVLVLKPTADVTEFMSRLNSFLSPDEIYIVIQTITTLEHAHLRGRGAFTLEDVQLKLQHAGFSQESLPDIWAAILEITQIEG